MFKKHQNEFSRQSSLPNLPQNWVILSEIHAWYWYWILYTSQNCQPWTVFSYNVTVITLAANNLFTREKRMTTIIRIGLYISCTDLGRTSGFSFSALIQTFFLFCVNKAYSWEYRSYELIARQIFFLTLCGAYIRYNSMSHTWEFTNYKFRFQKRNKMVTSTGSICPVVKHRLLLLSTKF
jgi:hypothetical protein